MTTFKAYARYYDLLYRDKDYGAEVEYLNKLIQTNLPGAATLLDLGCGTGNHDFPLRQKGYRVTGIDISGENIALAREKLDAQGGPVDGIHFMDADICDIRLHRRFDAVISVFHVMSYLTTNGELLAAFKTAAEHLVPGGIFIFDCWYGPAVLTELPATRVKRVAQEGLVLTRIAEPEIHFNKNCVDVHYELIAEKEHNTVQRIAETHRMRYLFQPEIESWLAAAGLELESAEEWLSGRPIGRDTWGGCFIARRRMGRDD
jgi:SAM-dependent methyltransferase